MRILIALAVASSLGCAALPSLDMTLDNGIQLNICWEEDGALPMSGALGKLANSMVRCKQEPDEEEE